MGAITFDPRTMSTGEARVDAQHHQLIAIINGLLEAMATGHGAHAVGGSLVQLQRYTETHFDYEEACMRRYACPVAAANEKAHAAFLFVLATIMEEFERIGPSRLLAIRLESAVANWLRGHIMGTDTKLRSCIPDEKRTAA